MLTILKRAKSATFYRPASYLTDCAVNFECLIEIGENVSFKQIEIAPSWIYRLSNFIVYKLWTLFKVLITLIISIVESDAGMILFESLLFSSCVVNFWFQFVYFYSPFRKLLWLTSAHPAMPGLQFVIGS